MTQRLTPDRLTELRESPRRLWGNEIGELFAHIDAVAADAVILAHAHADTARELEDARAELAALTTLRPIGEIRDEGYRVAWRYIETTGEWFPTGVIRYPGERAMGATHFTALPKPVTPA